MRNVYVLGLEPFNQELLQTLPQAEDCRFIELLSAKESVDVAAGFRLNELRELALQRIAQHGPADAILNYWDFPGACLAPLLCHDLGLPAADLRAVAKCEHKYWARLEMQQCVPEMTPAFCVVDPFDNPQGQINLPYPYWLKPFVSHSSYLGFKINNRQDLDHALEMIRDKIGHFGLPFNEFLDRVELPAELSNIGGCHCIAEEIISTEHQVTLEGYLWRGQLSVLGAIDSVREGGGSQSSFARYDYPSQLPAGVIARMEDALARLMPHIGYDNAAFNAEFFWDENTDRISLLEINTRLSKSHCPLFLYVDGQSHQSVGVDLGLGQKPRFRNGQGIWNCASKFMIRLFQDGEIKRVPHRRQINQLKARFPEALVQVLVDEGRRLSHLTFQDSYSFEIADLFLGGRDQWEVLEKYAAAMEILPFEVHLTAAPQKVAAGLPEAGLQRGVA